MFRKFFAFSILLISLFFTPTMVSAKDNSDYLVDNFVESCSGVINQWVDAKIIKGDKLYGIDDEQVGYLYRIYNEGTQYGYVLYLDESGISEATWNGTDRARDIDGKVYYITPGQFLSKKDFLEYLENEIEHITLEPGDFASAVYQVYDAGNGYYYPVEVSGYSFSSSDVPDLTDNVNYASGPYSIRYDIDNVPDYDWMYGCVPTSVAMLLAYYDNEQWDYLSSYDGAGSFPMYNTSTVNSFIYSVSTGYLGASYPDYGVGIVDEADGLEDYFEVHSLSTYVTYVGYFDDHDGAVETSISNYKDLIETGNPAVVNMISHPTYGDHAVLGYGYLIAAAWGQGIICHDTWSSTDEEIWITFNLLDSYVFIYND